jgi:hypothetical protein
LIKSGYPSGAMRSAACLVVIWLPPSWCIMCVAVSAEQMHALFVAVGCSLFQVLQSSR